MQLAPARRELVCNYADGFRLHLLEPKRLRGAGIDAAASLRTMRLPPGTPRMLPASSSPTLLRPGSAPPPRTPQLYSHTVPISFYHTNRAQRPSTSRLRPGTARPVAELRAAIARAAVYKRAFPPLTFLPPSPRASTPPLQRELQYAEEPPPLPQFIGEAPRVLSAAPAPALDIDLASISLVRSALSRAAAMALPTPEPPVDRKNAAAAHFIR